MTKQMFFSLSGEEQTLLAAVLAILIAKGLDEDQLNIFGNFLLGVGQNLIIIQTVLSSQPQPPSQPETTDSISRLADEIEILKARIARLEGG